MSSGVTLFEVADCTQVLLGTFCQAFELQGPVWGMRVEKPSSVAFVFQVFLTVEQFKENLKRRPGTFAILAPLDSLAGFSCDAAAQGRFAALT